jgi:hypothetical protein
MFLPSYKCFRLNVTLGGLKICYISCSVAQQPKIGRLGLGVLDHKQFDTNKQ